MDVQAFSARLASLASRQASKNEVHFCLLVFSSLVCPWIWARFARLFLKTSKHWWSEANEGRSPNACLSFL